MRWSQLVVKMRLPGLLRISFKQTCLQTNMICLQYILMDLMLSILKKVRTCNKVIFFSPQFNLHFNNKKNPIKTQNKVLQGILSGTAGPQYKDSLKEGSCLAPSILKRNFTRAANFQGGMSWP